MTDIIQRPLAHGAARQTPHRIIVHSMCEFIRDGEHTLHAVDFLNKIKLSAHAFVTPLGTVIRCRDDDQGAWHAKGHNTGSLGIEFLVPDVFEYGPWTEKIKRPWVTKAQLEAGVEFVRAWRVKYQITQIERHSDVDPGRKVDPGAGFPWDAFLEAVCRNGGPPGPCSLSDW